MWERWLGGSRFLHSNVRVECKDVACVLVLQVLAMKQSSVAAMPLPENLSVIFSQTLIKHTFR